MPVFLPNIPASGDQKSVSQGQIQGNFQVLGSMVNGINNSILLERQTVAPTPTATQVGLYNLVSGVTNTLMVKNGVGTPVDILTAGKNANGWCALPCGLYMVWGTVNVGHGAVASYTFSTSAGFPGFSGIPYFVQATAVYNGGNNPVYKSGLSAIAATIYNSSTAHDMDVYVFVIGPA
jgi:hypothetical protein